MRPTAYSLIRFSTPGQADGDSFRRQNGPTVAFADKHSLELDTSLHESDVRRLAVGAFRGAQIRKGALGKFIRAVEAGTVKPGSWLIVEEIDRLTRQVHDQAYDLCLTLMRKGIKIATMMDGEVYDIESINSSLEKRLKLMLRLDAAHEYSAKLSNRITSVWSGRREAMRAGDPVATNACPSWLEAVDGKFVKREDRVVVLKRIIAYRHLGLGRKAIATKLNDRNQPGGRVPTFRGGYGWHPTTIATIVKNKALIGIYQPRKADGTPDGTEIPNRYPRIISDTDFYLAQFGPENKVSRGRNPKGYWSLLKGVVKCRCCGHTMIGLNTGKHEHSKFLICDRSRYGMCENRKFVSYPKLESELLSALVLFDFSRLLNRTDPKVERIAGLEAEIAQHTMAAERLVEHFKANTPTLVLKQIEMLSARVEALTAELAETRQSARIAEAQATRDAYAEFRQMVETLPEMPDDETRFQLRARIAAELRQLIESGAAIGSELTLVLKGDAFHRYELLFDRSVLIGLRVTDIATGGRVLFRKEDLIGDDGVAGLFAGHVGPDVKAA